VGDSRKQVIRDLFETWNEGDREAGLEVSHEDSVLHSAITNSTFRGHEGIRRWMAEIDEQFDAWRLELEAIRELEDERLLALGRVRAHGRASGLELDQPIGWLIEFRGEKIAETWFYMGHDEALRAAGLG
jgi:ketosteroid isomerase-like protein